MKLERVTGILRSPILTWRWGGRNRLTWVQLVEQSALSADTRRLVVQVVRKTGLWPQEKYDVAEELVSHFVEGHELGKSESELIAHFGSPSQVARLIRRSKKKGRSLLWHAMAWTRLGIVSLCVVYALVLLASVSPTPSPRMDYKALLDQINPPRPDEGTAKAVYLDIFRDYGIRKFDNSSPESSDWQDTVSLFREKYRLSVPEIRRAAAYKHSGLKGKFAYEYSQEEYMAFYQMSEKEYLELYANGGPVKETDRIYTVADILLPQAGLYKHLCNIIRVNILIALNEKRYGEIPVDIETIMRISSHCVEQPLLINQLVSIACQWQAQDIARRLLLDRENLPDVQVIRQLLDIFRHTDALHQFEFGAEKYLMKDLIQHIYSDDGSGDGIITLQGTELLSTWMDDPLVQTFNPLVEAVDDWVPIVGESSRAVMAMFLNSDLKFALLPIMQEVSPRRRAVTEYLEALWMAVEECSQLPLWELQNYIKRWESGAVDFHAGGIHGVPSSENLGVFYRFFHSIGPKSAYKFVMSRAHHENTQLILALHGYFIEQGKWPERLSDLVPGWLAEVPLDATTGKPLVYRIENDGPLVYGRGFEGVDNGGQFIPRDRPGFHWSQSDPEEGDWIIWPVPVKTQSSPAAEQAALQ